MANAGSITSLDPSLRFATFGFVKIFGSIAVSLALIHCAKKQRKEEVKGMILPSMFVAAVAGITEPLDFSFLFASPLLWLVHSLLTAVSETILWGIGARTYMLYGLIDTFVSNSVFSPSVTKFYLVILVGVIMSVIWYFVFVLLINKLNIKTPGREDEESEEAVLVNETNGEFTADGSADFDLVVAGLGGRENIESISNCFTRLRVTVKDEALVDSAQLERISQQKGVVLNGTSVQVIIGMGVQGFKEDICERLGMSES